METITNKQNFWCRNKYCQHLISIHGRNIFKETNGCLIKECRIKPEDCRGAHDEKLIKALPSIYKFNQVKKDSIDWIKLYLEIKTTIENDKIKLKSIDHKEKTNDLTKYNFIELIQLWRYLACFYRKLVKQINIDGETIEGFASSNTIPQFNISDKMEDVAWSFERLTRKCLMQEKFNESISKNIQVTLWDVCIATGINCKEGVHSNNELICKEDFLTGRCSCQTNKDINDQIAILSEKLNSIKDQENDTTWKVKNKKKNDSKLLISSLEDQINNLSKSRLIHYTEQGMRPFDELYKNYLFEENKKIEEQNKLDNVDIDIKIKPVIKLVKFGKK
jgi:hypothetical protein